LNPTLLHGAADSWSSIFNDPSRRDVGDGWHHGPLDSS